MSKHYIITNTAHELKCSLIFLLLLATLLRSYLDLGTSAANGNRENATNISEQLHRWPKCKVIKLTMTVTDTETPNNTSNPPFLKETGFTDYSDVATSKITASHRVQLHFIPAETTTSKQLFRISV